VKEIHAIAAGVLAAALAYIILTFAEVSNPWPFVVFFGGTVTYQYTKDREQE
jgi:hypothetical protein